MRNHDLEKNQKHPEKEMPRYTEIAINSLALSQEGKVAFCKFSLGGVRIMGVQEFLCL